MEESYDVVNFDNKEYIVLDEIDNYVYLSNIVDENDICIRKSVIKSDGEYFINLKDEEEFVKALRLFDDKNKLEQ